MRTLMEAPKIDGSILVVDDEPAILEVHRRVLQKYNMSVLPARDGMEALEMFIDQGDSIPIVITDVNMPRMSGIQLVMEVLKRKPLTQIVVITAHLDDALALYGVKSNVVCLPKPVEPEFVAIAAAACNVRYKEQKWQQELKVVTQSLAWDEKAVLAIVRNAPWLRH